MKETRYLISETAKLVQVEPHVLRYWKYFRKSRN